MDKKQQIKAARDLFKQIRQNKELMDFEIKGFVKGAKKGKTMNVKLNVLLLDIRKQFNDLTVAISQYLLLKPESEKRLKQALADVRNVCGCSFIKLLEKQAIDQAKFAARLPK